MLQALKLLIPALLPSWRFFDVIAPSPRIQFVLLNPENEVVQDWQEFRPRPRKLSFLQMLGHLFWNPVWNESLYMVSCAERIVEQYTEHSESEILNRIKLDLRNANYDLASTQLQFRLLLIQRQGSELQQEVVFLSRLELLTVGNLE